MSNVDDLRELFEDVIASELRALSVTVERLEERFADLGKRLDADHARSMLAMTQRSDYSSLAKRVAAIGERGSLLEARADH